MSLNQLKTRYFGTAGQAFDGTTGVTFFVDGATYFDALATDVGRTVAADAVYIVGWLLDPTFPFGITNPPGELADMLTQQAHLGVDVRIVLNGAQYLGADPTGKVPAFSPNWEALVDLTSRVPSGAATPPLAGRVLYDWSGAELTGSHHQKATVLVHRGLVTAYVGGMDYNPVKLDEQPHHTRTTPNPAGWTVPWGWHDAAVRLVGGAAVSAYENFSDRWDEARTLPAVTLWLRDRLGTTPVKPVTYGPPATTPVPPPPSLPAPNPMSDMSVKVLRSRWRTKIDRSSVTEPWLTRGGGEIVEVHDALVAAIRGAQRYVYIEDQFLGDHPEPEDPANLKWWVVADVMTGGLRLWTFSLLPELEAALSRGVKVILVGSGYADPGDLTPGPKNRAVHPELSFMATTHPANLAIWRIEQQTVHSKLMVIDDAFAAVGSANLQARSMIGIDHELHVAVIDALDRVKGLRKKLWREHLGVIGSGSPDFEAGLDDIADALGMWRSGWGSGGRWFTSGDPDSFTPATLPASGTRSQVVRAYVGPGATP